MKKIFLIVLVLFAAKLSFSQSDSSKTVYDVSKWKFYVSAQDYQLTDTLKIFGLNYSIIISTTDFKYMTDERTQINVLIKDFQLYAADKIDKFPDYPRSRITYNVIRGWMFIDELDAKDRVYYSAKRDSIRNAPWPSMSEVVILSPWLNLKIQYRDESVLFDSTLQTVLNEVIALKTPKEWAKLELVYASNYEGNSCMSLEQQKTQLKATRKDESKIKFHVACGLATTKSSPVLTSEIKIGYETNFYNRYRYYYYLSYDWNFSFAENGDRSINGFLNLSTLETQFVPRLNAMGGIDMGYLIFRQGDVFEKNTFRIGLGFKGDFFYVSPQLYFPGSFKGVYPGLRLNIGI